MQEIQVNSLSDVSGYVSEKNKRGAVIVDLDGVLCCRGKENNVLLNVSRMKNLLEIVEDSDRVLFSTARVDLKKGNFWSDLIVRKVEENQKSNNLAVCYCPFLTEDSKMFLESLIQRKNSECLIDFDATPKKYLGKNEKTLKFAKRALDDELDLTIIGSGFFDKIIARKVVAENEGSFNRVNFFGLGWGLL